MPTALTSKSRNGIAAARSCPQPLSQRRHRAPQPLRILFGRRDRHVQDLCAVDQAAVLTRQHRILPAQLQQIAVKPIGLGMTHAFGQIQFRAFERGGVAGVVEVVVEAVERELAPVPIVLLVRAIDS